MGSKVNFGRRISCRKEVTGCVRNLFPRPEFTWPRRDMKEATGTRPPKVHLLLKPNELRVLGLTKTFKVRILVPEGAAFSRSVHGFVDSRWYRFLLAQSCVAPALPIETWIAFVTPKVNLLTYSSLYVSWRWLRDATRFNGPTIRLIYSTLPTQRLRRKGCRTSNGTATQHNLFRLAAFTYSSYLLNQRIAPDVP